MRKAVVMATLLMAFMLATPMYAATTNADTTSEPASGPTVGLPTWFMMTGLVNSYGGEPAHGSLWSCGEVGNQTWAMANAFFAPGNWTWMDGNWACMGGQEGKWMWTPKNYTYSFCTARLVNASLVALNYTKDSETYDLYISGLWNVYNISITYVFYEVNVTRTYDDHEFSMLCLNCTRTSTYTPLALNETGELYVTGNWTYPIGDTGTGQPTWWIRPPLLTWNLNITGVALIGGEVVFYCVRPLRPIPLGGCLWCPSHPSDGRVDIWDLVHVARAYGSTPGTPDYDFNVDFSFNAQQPGIGLCDLTTVAANLGETY